jgi:DNA-binding transcriptional MerR regulator
MPLCSSPLFQAKCPLHDPTGKSDGPPAALGNRRLQGVRNRRSGIQAGPGFTSASTNAVKFKTGRWSFQRREMLLSLRCILVDAGGVERQPRLVSYNLNPLEDQEVASQKKYSIGELAKTTEVKVSAIRYYEEIGLLPSAKRESNNRRTYDAADVGRLRFIRRARSLGFDLHAVRQLLALAGLPEEPCEGADEIARGRLLEIEVKIAQLTGLQRELRSMTEQGVHGRIRECRVIEALAGDE